ncbi:MAG: response regulator [Variibacter sp.]|nr:response regulator [Variibacter sp.]
MVGVNKILLVEDEELVREWLQDALEEAGYTVVAVANADQAVAVLESRNDIYLVLTDIDMPGSMDGLKLAAAVRDRWPPVKIIVTSGKHRPDAHLLPTDSVFLPKPYGSRRVVEAIQSFSRLGA